MNEPVAFAVVSDEIVSPTVSVDSSTAERLADTCGGTVVPLYSRHPSFTLTEDERTAIQWVLGEAKIDDRVSVEATLRQLLARCALSTRDSEHAGSAAAQPSAASAGSDFAVVVRTVSGGV